MATALKSSNSQTRNKKVVYYHHPEVGDFYYAPNHPMKPHRLAMTHSLILNYGLHKHMRCYVPRPCTDDDLMRFHSAEYVDFLKRVTPDNIHSIDENVSRYFNVGEDCPVFEGLYDYVCTYSGGSIEGAIKLNQGTADVAINWAGGLHHARKDEAAGFCYINDIVLGILELLKTHPRVVYIDIDIHHGDGVQEAFYATDRVMTVSFHKFGDYFFPGTGDVDEIGALEGKRYSVNVPLRDGLDDASFLGIFKPVMENVMQHYRPTAVVLQCGTDSLGRDRIGCFNLSIQGHGAAVAFMRKFGLPMLVLGGGGYNIRNVARCWTYETAVLCGKAKRVPADLPYNEYLAYYAPDFTLFPDITSTPRFANQNTRSYLERLQATVVDMLRDLQGAPAVQMHELPPPFWPTDNDDEEEDAAADAEGDSQDMMISDADVYDSAQDVDKEDGATAEEGQGEEAAAAPAAE